MIQFALKATGQVFAPRKSTVLQLDWLLHDLDGDRGCHLSWSNPDDWSRRVIVSIVSDVVSAVVVMAMRHDIGPVGMAVVAPVVVSMVMSVAMMVMLGESRHRGQRYQNGQTQTGCMKCHGSSFLRKTGPAMHPSATWPSMIVADSEIFVSFPLWVRF